MSAKSIPPIVAFAHHPWDEPEWMNRQQLLSRLGKFGWSVAYSHGALDWWQRGSPTWQKSPLLNKVIDRDHIRDIIPGRLGARWRRNPTLDRVQISRHAKFCRNAVARPNQRIIALLFDPQFYPYIEHLQPCDVAFHAYDAYAHQSGWNQQKETFQKLLIESSFLVTASSKAIARYLQSEKTLIIPNGADVDAFYAANELPEPFDLAPIPHPRIGYAGAINRKVDIPLVEEIATRQPNWHWVLVGRIEENELLSDEYTRNAYRTCRSLPNVHFLGQKDRREVPAYVGNMDINTMCYRSKGDGWWTAISPLKLHEYLATGLPIISSPIESVCEHTGVVSICEEAPEWIHKINEIISAEDDQLSAHRVATAADNSWDSIAEKLASLLLETPER